MARRRKILVDFDGVIHSYTSGWKGVTTIPDPPVEGVKEGISSLREKSDVYVLSTRGVDDEGVEAIQAYLDEHGIEVDGVVKKKIPASLLIDDRAFRFNGDWGEVVEFVGSPTAFTPGTNFRKENNDGPSSLNVEHSHTT